MKICQTCGAALPDNVIYCTQCGKPVGQVAEPVAPPVNVPPYGQNPGYQPNNGYRPEAVYPYQAPVVDPYDHTAEFDAKDISDNKVVCMLIYLSGYLGILVALLLAGTSKYVGFHLRQALKIEVMNILLVLVAVVGAFLFLIPTIIAGCLMVALYVVKFICFFQICSGKAKEAPIVRKVGFMK